jgi:hypothetical protein
MRGTIFDWEESITVPLSGHCHCFNGNPALLGNVPRIHKSMCISGDNAFRVESRQNQSHQNYLQNRKNDWL